MSRILRIKPDSDAERLFASLTKCCKDKISIRLGEIFGHPEYNEYEVSDEDFERLRKEIKKAQE